MNAKTQYKLSAADLELILALVRTGTLALAGERLEQDPSTVFRAVQRIERGFGQKLFERSRTGYEPSEQAQLLASHAEQIEAHLEAARSSAQQHSDLVSGSVRITTTDTILHGLVAPALRELRATQPLLNFELHAGNELASLTRRDADIAVRATKRPPQHLIGKHIGPIRVALYAAKSMGMRRYDESQLGGVSWIAPDEGLPDHPTVIWRKKHFPKVLPTYRVNSILTVMELVARGLGVGLMPVFLARERADLRALTPVLDECQTELWLLTHTETRHLRRVSAVYSHLSQHMLLD